MRVDLFDFDLPEDRIALRPAEPRDSARMLHVVPSAARQLTDRHVRDLPDVLRPGDVLVVNDTRVIPARLEGRRTRGASVRRFEATLHKRESPERWRAFVKPAKRIEAGDSVRFGAVADGAVCELDGLDARVVEKGDGGEVVFEFAMSGPVLDEMIERIGTMPLPPYIAGKRATDVSDASDYQTLFAEHAGAVAAPTAGLHFTPQLLERIAARGIEIRRVTLHVGAGTFLPVKAEDTDDHSMHSEYGIVTQEVADALNGARARGGRIVPVGTTSLRILESAADESGTVQAYSGDTSIFITPGYRFRATDLLLTNFHLPRSTLFMLVCACCGIDLMKRAYAHAIETGYRFYSYGDACLLEPQTAAERGALS